MLSSYSVGGVVSLDPYHSHTVGALKLSGSQSKKCVSSEHKLEGSFMCHSHVTIFSCQKVHFLDL